jgi:tetratricopeptide (TPR) repeat protein
VHSNLARALEAESRGEWLQSHVLCEKALLEAPEDPDALNLLGRLCAVAGDASRAIALQSFVLYLVPGHSRAAGDLESARRAITGAAEARRLYAEAVRAEPDIACHLRHFLSMWPFAGMDRIDALLRDCIALDPSHADAHAALGNLHARREDRFAAIAAYGIATMLRWQFPGAHLAIADLLESVREEGPASRHRAEALSQKRLYPACGISARAVRRVLVLATNGGAIENAPLDLVVNPTRTALHRFYTVGEPPDELPVYDLIFNGIEELEASAPSIERATRLADASNVPVLNHPRNLIGTRRWELHRALAEIDGCSVPPSVRLERDDVAALTYPAAIRPVDSHRGDGFERVGNDAETADYLRRIVASAYVVSPFVDYRSPDGFFRKYRIIVVDGVPLPYHLAISDRWVVHYAGSLMPEHAWMREEEERFLADPASVFLEWHHRFGAIARALRLDYFGVDCSIALDGTIVIFECNAGMLVQCRDDSELFAYKYRYVPRIFDAFERMLDKAARPSLPNWRA